jgi:hypothetical protein
MNAVMRIVKEKKLVIIDQQLMENCRFTVAVRKTDAASIFDLFNNLYKVAIKKLET